MSQPSKHLGLASSTPAGILMLAYLLFFVTPATANTHFDDTPGSCKVIGDPDVYGIGIRLGYYLQWVAVLLATWIAPEEANTARTASNIFTLAVLANTLHGASNKNDLIAPEFYIVVWLTLFLSLFNLPTSIKLLKDSTGSVGFMFLLFVMINFALPWLFFTAVDQGHKEGCTVKIFFFFDLNLSHNSGWRIFFKVTSVLGVFTGLSFLFVAVFIIIWGFRVDRHGADDVQTDGNIYFKTILTISQLLSGALTIMQIEMTIKINHIDLSSAGFVSSGQLIPFFIGCFTLLSVFGSGLRGLFRPSVGQIAPK